MLRRRRTPRAAGSTASIRNSASPGREISAYGLPGRQNVTVPTTSPAAIDCDQQRRGGCSVCGVGEVLCVAVGRDRRRRRRRSRPGSRAPARSSSARSAGRTTTGARSSTYASKGSRRMPWWIAPRQSAEARAARSSCRGRRGRRRWVEDHDPVETIVARRPPSIARLDAAHGRFASAASRPPRRADASPARPRDAAPAHQVGRTEPRRGQCQALPFARRRRRAAGGTVTRASASTRSGCRRMPSLTCERVSGERARCGPARASGTFQSRLSRVSGAQPLTRRCREGRTRRAEDEHFHDESLQALRAAGLARSGRPGDSRIVVRVDQPVAVLPSRRRLPAILGA